MGEGGVSSSLLKSGSGRNGLRRLREAGDELRHILDRVLDAKLLRRRSSCAHRRPVVPRPGLRTDWLRPVTAGYDHYDTVSTGYSRLQPVTAGYNRLQPVTAGYSRLQPVTSAPPGLERDACDDQLPE